MHHGGVIYDSPWRPHSRCTAAPSTAAASFSDAFAENAFAFVDEILAMQEVTYPDYVPLKELQSCNLEQACRPHTIANLLHRNPGGRIPRRHGAGRRHGALGC